jgi:NAD(P)-dependent dehydrogenase (short-subunit alcohol dehydrogenase family)
VHTPFVDRFLAESYPGQEAEMFATLAATQPIGRMAEPEEIAAFAAYLCSEEAAFVTGSNHLIDGGFTGVRR